MTHWVSWAGWPRIVTTDRGTHNRGVFVRILGKNGVYVRNIGLESPEHLGRGERHGGIIRTNMKKIIREHQITTKVHIKMAMADSLSEKNEYMRRGGFSPSQWVLGRAPRGVGHMLDE